MARRTHEFLSGATAFWKRFLNRPAPAGRRGCPGAQEIGGHRVAGRFVVRSAQAQQVGRVIGCREERLLGPGKPATALVADFEVRVDQRRRGGHPEAENHPGANDSDLLAENIDVGRDLLGARRAVGLVPASLDGGPNLHQVGNPKLAAREVDHFEEAIESLSSRPMKRPASRDFFLPRRFADQHERGVEVSFAKDLNSLLKRIALQGPDL